MSLYLIFEYGFTSEASWLQTAWAKTGKKLGMGKCCIRFKKLEDLSLDVIGEAIRRLTAKKYIEQYESLLRNSRQKPTTKTAKARRATKPAAATKGPPAKRAKT